MNLSVECFPPCKLILWNYTKPDKIPVNHAINTMELEERFAIKTIDTYVFKFTELPLNIYLNILPTKLFYVMTKIYVWLNKNCY